MSYIIINNQILPEEKALISIKDRGFRFGDGIFETCLIRNKNIYNFNSHLKRLILGLKAIKINLCDSHKESISQLAYFLIDYNFITDGFIRITISRGEGSIGYLPKNNIKPNIIIETLPNSQQIRTPVALTISNWHKPSLKSMPVNYKLMQGLNSSLVKMDAIEKGYFDAIIINHKKQICETSSANIFWIKDDILYTPHHNCGCILGTIRDRILKLSPIKTKFKRASNVDELLKADEVFITNVAIGVLKIDLINEVKFTKNKYSKIFAKILEDDINKKTRSKPKKT